MTSRTHAVRARAPATRFDEDEALQCLLDPARGQRGLRSQRLALHPRRLQHGHMRWAFLNLQRTIDPDALVDLNLRLQLDDLLIQVRRAARAWQACTLSLPCRLCIILSRQRQRRRISGSFSGAGVAPGGAAGAAAVPLAPLPLSVRVFVRGWQLRVQWLRGAGGWTYVCSWVCARAPCRRAGCASARGFLHANVHTRRLHHTCMHHACALLFALHLA